MLEGGKMVSVVIPTYNGAEYLAQAIESILSQTLQDFELIVINDGSLDETSAICERYQKAHPAQMRYFHQPNKGVSAARNKGVKLARGEYVAFLDDDDIADTEWLENLMSGFSSDDIDVCAGRTTSLCYSDSLIQSIVSLNSSFDEDFADRSRIKEFMICSAMIRKHVFEELGGFDEALPYGAEDNCLTYRLNLADKKMIYIADAIVHYRPRTTLKKLLRQRYLYGQGKVILYYKYKAMYKCFLEDFCELTKKIIVLLFRAAARIVKYIFLSKYRRVEFVLEHPLAILCVLANHCGRIVRRVKSSNRLIIC